MAEASNEDREPILDDLEKGDLRPNVYEGGFKTWECAVDLAEVVAEEEEEWLWAGDGEGDVHVIEVSIVRLLYCFWEGGLKDDAYLGSWEQELQCLRLHSISRSSGEEGERRPEREVFGLQSATTTTLCYDLCLCPTFSLRLTNP